MRDGSRVNLFVGPRADSPDLTDLDLARDEAIDNRPRVAVDHELAGPGHGRPERIASLGILLKQEDLLQHPGGHVRAETAEVINRGLGEDDLCRSHPSGSLAGDCRVWPKAARTSSTLVRRPESVTERASTSARSLKSAVARSISARWRTLRTTATG